MGRNDEIRNRLESLAEPEFQRFASSLIPDLKPGFLLGVRLPKLRKISREIAGNDPQGYLKEARSDSFEEIMLQGMVIGCIPGKPEQVFPLIEGFLPKIDNWSICDSFCSSLKIAREYPEATWKLLRPLFQDQRAYYVRFAVVMAIFYFIQKPYLPEIFAFLDEISLDSYYVRMAVAWAVSICFREFPEETMTYLETAALDQFTYEKSLQKITESLKTDAKTKALIREMKRKKRDSGER